MNATPLPTALALGLVVVLLLGCGRPASQRPGNLSDREWSALQDAADRLGEEVSFDPIAPRYLPIGLERVHEADSLAGDAYLIFGPTEDYVNGEERPLLRLLSIRESPDSEPLRCDERPVPTDPDFRCDELSVLDRAVTVETVPTADDEVADSFSFRAEDLSITVELTWRLADSAPMEITENAKQEGLRVAESLIGGD